MIQRIQTIFLLVGIAINAFIFSMTLAIFNYQNSTNDYTIMGLIDRETGAYIFSSWLTPGLCISAILVAIVSVFLFKKRGVQVKLAQLALFFQTAFVASIFYFVDQAANGLENVGNEVVEVEYVSGSWLSIVPILFFFMAIRSIRKDEKLIKAADRLR